MAAAAAGGGIDGVRGHARGQRHAQQDEGCLVQRVRRPENSPYEQIAAGDHDQPHGELRSAERKRLAESGAGFGAGVAEQVGSASKLEDRDHQQAEEDIDEVGAGLRPHLNSADEALEMKRSRGAVPTGVDSGGSATAKAIGSVVMRG